MFLTNLIKFFVGEVSASSRFSEISLDTFLYTFTLMFLILIFTCVKKCDSQKILYSLLNTVI